MFDYYYGDESEQFSFLMLPRILFSDKEKYGSLSIDAKIVYSFLFERMTLSRKNGWFDNENHVYIIYTLDEICETMSCSSPKAVKLLQTLDEDKGIGLIRRKRRGQGKTDIIYVRCADETEQFSFLMIPKVFFTEKEIFGSLSNEAKILYAFLHERMTLSRKNGWLDEKSRVYIVYTVDEICDTMNCSHGTAVKLLQELDEDKGIGLIQKKRRGQGKTAIIYVKNFVRSDTGYSVFPKKPVEDVENSVESSLKAVESQDDKPPCKVSETGDSTSEIQNVNSLTLKNCTSRNQKFRSQEVQKFKASNININNTDLSYIDINQSVPPAQKNEDFSTALKRLNDMTEREAIEMQVRAAIEYDYLYPDDETLRGMVTEIKDIMVDVMCGYRTVVIGGRVIPHEVAKSVYSKLTSDHIRTALYNIFNYPDHINRIDNFISVVLYNAAFTENLSTFAGFTANTHIKLIE